MRGSPYDDIGSFARRLKRKAHYIALLDRLGHLLDATVRRVPIVLVVLGWFLVVLFSWMLWSPFLSGLATLAFLAPLGILMIALEQKLCQNKLWDKRLDYLLEYENIRNCFGPDLSDSGRTYDELIS